MLVFFFFFLSRQIIYVQTAHADLLWVGSGSGIHCFPRAIWVYACVHHQGPIDTVVQLIQSLLCQVSSRHMQFRVNPGYHVGFRGSSHISIFQIPLFLVLWLKKFRFCLPVVLHTMSGSSLGPKLRPQGRKNITGILPSTHTLFGVYGCPLFQFLLAEYCDQSHCTQPVLCQVEGGVPRVLSRLLLMCSSGIQAPQEIQEGKIWESHHHIGCYWSFNPPAPICLFIFQRTGIIALFR